MRICPENVPGPRALPALSQGDVEPAGVRGRVMHVLDARDARNALKQELPVRGTSAVTCWRRLALLLTLGARTPLSRVQEGMIFYGAWLGSHVLRPKFS